MNANRTHNRSRRRYLPRFAAAAIAGIALLAAAFVIAPNASAPAQAQAGAAAATIVWNTGAVPAKPTNLRGYYSDVRRDGWRIHDYRAFLDWNEGPRTGNVFCLTLLGGMRCFYRANEGQATSYVIQTRQLEQQNHRGYPIQGEHDWKDIARVSGTSHDDSPFGTPPRNLDYRVKACNDNGCSGWSNTLTLRIAWSN